MNRIFDLNNPFFKFMNKFVDMVFLSAVFTICCLPLVTLGPALTALYYSTVKAIRRDRSYPVKEFFHSFKRDFGQSFIAGVILAVFGVLAVLDVRFVIMNPDSPIGYARYLYLAFVLLAAFVSVYVFPLISRFSMKLSGVLKLSVYLSIRHFLTTVTALILLLAAGYVCLITSGLALFIMPALVSLLDSLMIEKVLKRVMEMQGGAVTDDNADQWYME